MMQDLGKYIIIMGMILVLTGAVIFLSGKIPFLGKLPGDIIVKKENFVFVFPVVSCILISIVLSVIAGIFFKK